MHDSIGNSPLQQLTMIKSFALFVLALVTFTAQLSTAQAPETNTQLYVVQPGDSLYAIVKMQFPDHQGSWLDVAERLVELNPDAFPQGFDTPLRPGTQLQLYLAATESTIPAADTVKATNPETAQITVQTPSAIASDGRGSTAHELPKEASAVARENSVAHGPVYIGIVTLAGGHVIAIDTEERRRNLTNGAELFAGDTVITNASSSVSLRMIDETVYLLRARSSLAFESYAYAPESRKGQSVVTLIAGGFRATGGHLAKHGSGNVTYNTPVATVGVRGTDFGLRLCSNNNCRAANGNVSFDDGLYTGVLDGTLSVTNNSGELLTGTGEFYRVENPADKPVPAPEAARLIFTPEELAVLNIGVETTEPLSFWAWLVNFLFGD